jgi:hypothetical protein
MSSTYDDEDIPLALVRRAPALSPLETESLTEVRSDYRTSVERDRMRPASAGALTGLVAGAAGLGVVQGLHAGAIGLGITRLGAALALPPDAAVPLAYLGAGLAGALIGAGFASMTRHLRRFVPLLAWALVFFTSLALLLLALSSTYGHGLGVSMAPAILVASAAFAILASLELPLRRRS